MSPSAINNQNIIMQFTKKKLYRKVNTKARGVFHLTGIDYKHVRNKKRETTEQVRWSMHGKKLRWLDYTPLFRFLLSKEWQKWDDVFSEAVYRLDSQDPIFWMVAIHEHEKQDYFIIWESSYYSGMYVDEQWILRLTNPNFKSSDIGKKCTCCTHTFNGKVF